MKNILFGFIFGCVLINNQQEAIAAVGFGSQTAASSGGGAPVGTLVNTNVSVKGQFAVFNNTTKTNIVAGASIDVTYVGTPLTPFIFPLEPSVIVVTNASGNGTFTEPGGVTLSAFSYAESSAIPGYITSLVFNDLTGVSGSFNPTTMPELTNLSFPALTTIGGNFNPNTMAVLTNLSAPVLTTVGGVLNINTMAALLNLSLPALTATGSTFGVATMAALTNLSLPALTTIGGNFSPNTMAALTNLSAPVLTMVGGTLNPNTMAALLNLSFPALTMIVGTFSPSSMAALTNISLPAMITYGSTISVPSASMANVAGITLGTSGTLKAITGSTITLSGLKIPTSDVNALLALLVTLDGTGGTTLWGSGKTLLINGGTNGAPSGQGVTDAATLVARGATVTTN